MNTRFVFSANRNRDVGDASFQINTGLCAEQSQLNDLEFDLDDAFDELNSHTDPFATPLPISRSKTPAVNNNPTSSVVNPIPFQSTLLPESSQKRPDIIQHSDTPIPDASILRTTGQPTPDDFFHIRMRNGNSHAGIDLSSKSTARLWKAKDKTVTPEEFEAIIQSKIPFAHTSIPSHIESTPVPTIIAQPDCPPTEENSLVLADLDVTLKDTKAVQDTSMTDRIPVKPKSISKSSKSSKSSFSSASTRTFANAAKTLGNKGNKKRQSKEVEKTDQVERRRSSGSIASIGGGLIDALVSYGEKIRNSLGLSPNAPPDPEEPIQPDDVPVASVENNEPLSPRSSPKLKVALDMPFSITNISNTAQEHNEEPAIKADEVPLPIRTSKKRLLPLSPGRERKRKCIQDENANAHLSRLVPTYDEKALPSVDKDHEKKNTFKNTISRPRPLGASRNINRTSVHGTKGKPKLFGAVHAPPRSVNVLGPKSGNALMPGIDPQPLFASDVYRQLALEKDQKESEKPKVQFAKPAPPARPMLRPTIPAAFVFRSEERIAQRHAEANEKPKVEIDKKGHLTSHASSKPHSEGDSSSKRQPNPILSVEAPILNTMIRAKAREKFDMERKEREKILELQRLIRERERVEREEKDYREARKKTIPRAHEVPEWYKGAPHKQRFVE